MPKGVPNERYTPEFKKQVIEDLRNNIRNVRATMRKYGISDHKTIERWERIYLEEGAEGLSVERRGRATKMESVNKGRPRKLDKQVEEDLIAENQRLRMENEYLKKLQALVQKKEKSTKRKKRN
jgi:transposase-like protein